MRRLGDRFSATILAARLSSAQRRVRGGAAGAAQYASVDPLRDGGVRCAPPGPRAAGPCPAADPGPGAGVNEPTVGESTGKSPRTLAFARVGLTLGGRPVTLPLPEDPGALDVALRFCLNSLVGARTARVTMDAKLGPPAAPVALAAAGGRPGPACAWPWACPGPPERGGKAGALDPLNGLGLAPVIGDELDELVELDAAACSACAARTDGGGWKLGEGRGRTLFGR